MSYNKDTKYGDKKPVGFRPNGHGGMYPIFEEDDKEKKVKEQEKVIKFVKRFNLQKTSFKLRDEVVFDQMSKSGMVMGFVGDSIVILQKDGRQTSRFKNDVFKKSELIGGNHWDTMTLEDRYELLQKANVNPDYTQNSWFNIPFQVRNVIMSKAQGPAGYEGGGVNTSTSGTYNPVHQDMTVSQRIKEKEKGDNKNPTVDDEKKPEQKTYQITEVKKPEATTTNSKGQAVPTGY